MVVLGIDPGSVVTGWGVVRLQRGRYHWVGSGCIRTKSAWEMGTRLKTIHEGLVDALSFHKPDEVAIEAIFRHKSSESALRLGQARGVALLAAAQCGYEAAAYNPMTIKQSVGAHGRADKKGVAKMVEMLLGRKVEGPEDESDALAIAITHCSHKRSGGRR